MEKTSLYWKDGDGIAFDYVSIEKGGQSQKKVHFEGAWQREE